MPYIKQQDRLLLDSPNPDRPPTTPGELNYVITSLCLGYQDGAELYSVYNEIIGVLECVKQEFYRRAVAPYEDKKILENGDVY